MRCGITTRTSKGHIFTIYLGPLTNAISSTITAEVGGGIATSGLFFHVTDRACTLGDERTKDELCNKKECSLCAIIRDSFDVSRTGV